MVKNLKQRYIVNDKRVSFKELYCLANLTTGKKSYFVLFHITQANGVPIKVVFVLNRNKKSEWLAILITDCTLIVQKLRY